MTLDTTPKYSKKYFLRGLYFAGHPECISPLYNAWKYPSFMIAKTCKKSSFCKFPARVSAQKMCARKNEVVVARVSDIYGSKIDSQFLVKTAPPGFMLQ